METAVDLIQALLGVAMIPALVRLVRGPTLADRVIELSSGRVVSDGPPEGGRAASDELQW